MNNEGEITLPDVTTYSKATVIKITRYGREPDIDKSSMMYRVLDQRLFFFADCICLLKNLHEGSLTLSGACPCLSLPPLLPPQANIS